MVNFEISGDNTQLLRKLEETRRAVSMASKDIEASGASIDEFFSRATRAVATFGAAFSLKRFVQDVAEVRGSFQQLEIAFSTMLQSKAKANALMAEIAQTAARTPFDLQGVASGAKQLIAYGTEAEKVNDTLVMLGDIASGVSIPLGDIVYLYGTTITQGRLFTKDLTQFQGRGIPLAEELAKQFKVAKEEVAGLVSSGKVGAKEFQEAIESMAKSKFNNLMAEQSKSITGQLSNLGDQIQQIFNDIGKSNEGMISGAIEGISTIVSSYETIGKAIASLVAIYGSLRVATMAYTVAQMIATGGVTAFTGAIRAKTTALATATLAQIGLNKAVLANPYVIAGASIVALAGAIWTFSSSASTAEEATESLNDALKEHSDRTRDNRAKAEELIQTIRNSNETNYAREQAYQSLIAIYPSLLGKIDLEKIKTMELVDIVKELNSLRDQDTLGGMEKRMLMLQRVIDRNKKMMSGQAISEEEQSAFEEYNGGSFSLYPAGVAERAIAEQAMLKKKYSEERNRQYEASLSSEQKLSIAVDNRLKSEKELAVLKQKLSESVKLHNGNRFNAFANGIQSPDHIQAQIKIKEREIDGYRDKELALRSVVKEESKRTIEVVKKELEEKENAWDRLSLEEKRGNAGVKLRNEILELEKEKKAHELPSDKKIDADIKKRREEMDKLNRLEDDARRERERSIEDFNMNIQLIEIEALEEGGEKKRRAMEHNHKKEMLQLKREREDYLRNRVNRERDIFEQDPKNDGKVFNSSSIVLSTEEEEIFREKESSILKRQHREEAVLYKEQLEAYRGYIEQRQAMQDKYAKDRESLYMAGASQESINESVYQEQEALARIDEVFAQREVAFEVWTNAIASLSIENLVGLLERAKHELEKMEQSNPSNPQLATQRAKVSRLTKEIGKKNAETDLSPNKRSIEQWQKLRSTLSKVGSEFGEIGQEVGGVVGEVLASAGQIASATMQMIDGISSLASGAMTATEATAIATKESISSVEKASVILAVISAALQIATKIASLVSGDGGVEKYNDTKKAYESYIAILDKVINKHLELAKTLSGDNAKKAYQQAIDLVNKQAEAARELGKLYLDTGAKKGIIGIGSKASHGRKEVEDMTAKGWQEAASALGVGVESFKQMMGGRMSGLFDLSVEQLSKLQEQAPQFLAQLDDDTRKYLDQIIASKEKLADIADQEISDRTLLDKDSLVNDFRDLLSDFEASGEQFGKKFEEYLRNAILNATLQSLFRKRLEEWRERFGKAMEDGMSESEYEILSRQGRDISNEMIAKREEIRKMFGFKVDDIVEGSKGSFETMTQDQGRELYGRFTAMHQTSIAIHSVVVQSHELLEDLRGIGLSSTATLEKIEHHTRELYAIREKLEGIERNTRSLK